jgi:hypothetical protein
MIRKIDELFRNENENYGDRYRYPISPPTGPENSQSHFWNAFIKVKTSAVSFRVVNTRVLESCAGTTKISSLFPLNVSFNSRRKVIFVVQFQQRMLFMTYAVIIWNKTSFRIHFCSKIMRMLKEKIREKAWKSVEFGDPGRNTRVGYPDTPMTALVKTV